METQWEKDVQGKEGMLKTISAADYLLSIGKRPEDIKNYNTFFVSSRSKYADRTSCEYVAEMHAEDKITEHAMELGAEVVVDVRAAFHSNEKGMGLYMYGTALIPKKKK